MCDGHIVYQGEASESTDYFKNLGYKVRQFDNPADVFMRCLSINYPKTEEDENKINKLVSIYEKDHKPNMLRDDEAFDMPKLDM